VLHLLGNHTFRIRARNVRPALCHGARVLRAARAVAPQLIEAMGEIDVVAAEPALGQHKRDVGGEA